MSERPRPRIYSGTEIMAMRFAERPASPKWDHKPTWREVSRMEPMLKVLWQEARDYHKTADDTFCANEAWFGYSTPGLSLKRRMSRIVGWERKDGTLLSTSEAFDVAYTAIYGALPDCRHEGIY